MQFDITNKNPNPNIYLFIFLPQGWVTTNLVPISIVIFLGAQMNRAQRSGYLYRRRLRELKNETNGKNN